MELLVYIICGGILVMAIWTIIREFLYIVDRFDADEKSKEDR